MTPDVVAVAAGAPLGDVARLMADRGISGAPVLGPSGELIGVISEGDFLEKERGRPARTHGAFDRLLGRGHDDAADRKRAAQTAVQAMSAPPVTIDADRPVREAAAVMIDRAINRLPVMSSGRLVGIVTRADLVRAYLRRDDETLRTIRDDVLHDTMWIDPDGLQVEVRDGHVRLEGAVDRRSTATIVARLIGLVEGVDHVESRLTWDFDDTGIAPSAPDPEPGASSLVARERPRSLHG